MSINVAIDGPAGAGKSTIAKTLAAKLNFIYVDTGAMYRAMAVYMYENNVDISDHEAVTAACPKINIRIQYEEGLQNVILNERNVTGLLRANEISKIASPLSAIPVVREKLLDLQRNLAKENNVLMDGRDIGTNILPNADVKIYLTASVDVRAERRYLELKKNGQDCELETIKNEIIQRDHNDMTRAIAPLKKADDAVEVDTSDMDIEEVVETLYNMIVGVK